MAIQKFTENVNNVQALPDKPTESSDILKQIFDKAGNDIKDYINNILTTQIDASINNLDSNKIANNKIINDLTTGGATNVASAEMIKKLNNEKMSTAIANTELAKKANSSHTHDDRYYTESEVDTKLGGKANSSHTHTTSNITGLKSGATTKITSGTANPSGGDNGDIYIQYF